MVQHVGREILPGAGFKNDFPESEDSCNNDVYFVLFAGNDKMWQVGVEVVDDNRAVFLLGHPVALIVYAFEGDRMRLLSKVVIDGVSFWIIKVQAVVKDFGFNSYLLR